MGPVDWGHTAAGESTEGHQEATEATRKVMNTAPHEAAIHTKTPSYREPQSQWHGLPWGLGCFGLRCSSYVFLSFLAHLSACPPFSSTASPSVLASPPVTASSTFINTWEQHVPQLFLKYLYLQSHKPQSAKPSLLHYDHDIHYNQSNSSISSLFF